MSSTAVATLLIRLAGPMQSWGLDSRFDQRDTGLEPSKSGVLGLICAAFGKPRDDSPGPWPKLAQLAELKMGVRVLRQGSLRVEYQTAGGGDFAGQRYGVWKASGGIGGTVVSQRHFLSDADFLVGLEGDVTLLQQIEQALRAPVWPLSLGRKSYVPTLPVFLPAEPPEGPGLRHAELADALSSFLVSAHGRKRQAEPDRQRLVLQVALDSAVESRRDVPLSFQDRRFAARGIETRWLEVKHD
jgi:CRISPR system Cascade subunit CasD